MARVGFAYHPEYLKHLTGRHHPERPERLEAILRHLQGLPLWQSLVPIKPVRASLEWVEPVHPRAYLQAIERACREQAKFLDVDTVISPASYEVALLAVGGLLQSADAIIEGAIDRAFVCCRPPGHHAGPETAMGFCLLNNVAIGARYVQRRYGAQRVLIVDWDVHHGNGTQEIFYHDPSVLYFSTHEAPFYPGTGGRSERGRGSGQGLTVNVPLPPGSDDAAIVEAMREQLLPAAEQFRPEWIFISAGFDGHRDDPLAHFECTETGYGVMTQLVVDLAERYAHGRIISALEGGYHLPALAGSVAAHLEALQA